MKKRRLMALLLSVCVGISMLPMMAFADDGTAGEATPTAEDETKPTPTDAKYFKYEEGEYDEVNDIETYEITGYKGTASTVVIPDTINGKKVTSIFLYEDDDKYDKCFAKIRTLVIPEGVKDVSLNCYYMKQIVVPESVKTLDINGVRRTILDCKCGSYAEKWALSHDFPLASGTSSKVITKATFKKSAKVVNTCKKCGASKEAKVYRADACCTGAYKGENGFFYNGKTRNGHILVYAVDNEDGWLYDLEKGKDYTVKAPAGRKKIGVYYYTVTLKGKYSGTKKLAMKVAPKKTKITKISRGKKTLTVKWKKQRSQTSGYQVVYLSDKMKKPKVITVKNNKKTSVKIKKLKRKTKYYICIRTYKTVKGKKIGIWDVNNFKIVKTK